MRIHALFRRWRKKTNSKLWLTRWDHACHRCWAILAGGTPSKKRFDRFERNHNRLMQISTRRITRAK